MHFIIENSILPLMDNHALYAILEAIKFYREYYIPWIL